MDAFISGAWRTPTRAEIYIGGTWRRLSRAEVYRSSQWYKAVTFVSSLSLSAININRSAANRGKPVQVSGTSTATPSGGLAPYTYSWAITSGTATIASPNMATTAVYEVLAAGETSYSAATVTCTDALGSVATASISITLTNEGF